jgi:hypothetical protein
VLVLRIVLLLALLPSALACNPANCSKSSDCNQDGGEQCLFGAGAGCSAQGHCEKQDTCQATAGPPTPYCTCDGVNVAVKCVPSNGLTDRTNNGVCAVDGGTDE